MKCFLFGIVGGLVFALSASFLRLNVNDSHVWTDEQKLAAVCGGFIGVVFGLFALVSAILGPIVWIAS